MNLFVGGIFKESSSTLDKIRSGVNGNVYLRAIDRKDNHELKLESEALANADFELYVLMPGMDGFELVIEVVNASNKRPAKTGYLFAESEESKEFTSHQIKSLNAIGKMIDKNGGKWFESSEQAIQHINNLVKS